MIESGRPPRDSRLQPLDRAVARARLALAWEALWPRLVPILSLAGLYVVLSWFGLWRAVNDPVRLTVLGLFALATLWCLFRLARLKLPSRDVAMDRVERSSNLPHRPARGLADRISPVAMDGAAQALWRAHRERLLGSLQSLRAGPPRPDLARRDPNALRFIVPVLLAIAFPIAWGEWGERLGEGFTATAHPVAPASARIDAWIDPPAYTRVAPIFLSRRDPAAAADAIKVPEGSRLTVRVVSREPVTVELRSGTDATALPGTEKGSGTDRDAIRNYEATLDRDATVSITDAKGTTSYSLAILEDRPPTVERRPVEVNRSGSFTLPFAVRDDYGVTEGSVTFRPAAKQPDNARPLVDFPKLAMRIEQSRAAAGVARADGRLEEHPFAGLQVTADAVVRDAAGHEGRPPDAGAMTLPARLFTNPIAKALVEQRRVLALDANARERVATALDALTIAPDRFIKDDGIYLGLRIGYHRLVGARSDDDLRGVLDYLWAMARDIEDGDMSDAEKRLDAARQALEKAIQDGAPDQEIARLTDELRKAMQDFLQSYAAEMQKRGLDKMPDQNAQTLTQQDLDKMLDRIEDLAKLGDKAAAQELLSQMQQMLDNLQMAQRGQPPSGQQGEMMRQMQDLSQLLQQQQKLRDDTFGLDQGRRPGDRGQQSEQRPMTQSEMEELMKQLQAQQGDLQKQLQALLDKMKKGEQPGEGDQPGDGQQPGQGQQPGEGQIGQNGEGQGQGGQDGTGSFGRAGRAMGNAGRSLGQGESGSAYGYQGEALQAMREGMQGMMQQMQKMFGNQGGMPQQTGQGGQRGNDPLGRPQNRAEGPDLGQNVKVPDEIDVERARRILNAIRDRLGNRELPRFELDYLERLLQTE